MSSPKKLHSDTKSQKRRLLEHLIEFGFITTVEARSELDIMSPAPRIMEA